MVLGTVRLGDRRSGPATQKSADQVEGLACA